MGYEIWDDESANLVADFDDLNEGLGLLRDWVQSLTPQEATQTIARLHLAKISDEGEKIEVIARGVELFRLMYAPTAR